MLTTNTLAAFLHLAETNSFQDAAEKMGVSNASLSRYIGQAEEQSGFVLFQRSRHHCKLTRAGQEFLPVAQRLQRDLQQYAQRVETLHSSGGGQFRIGCGPLVSRSLVQPIMQEVLEDFPGLRFRVNVSARSAPLEELKNGDLDLFIGDLTHTPEIENVEILVIQKRPLVFLAHADHPVHAQGKCTLGQVFEHPFASPHLHKHWRATVFQALGGDEAAEETVNRLPQVESDDYAYLTELLRKPQFVVAGMPETFAEQMALGDVKEIPLRQPISWNICAVRKTGQMAKGGQQFWEKLSAHSVNVAAKPHKVQTKAAKITLVG